MYRVSESAFIGLKEEGAYWVGFLMGNGYVHAEEDEEPILIVRVPWADRAHLTRLKRFLESTHPVKKAKRRNGRRDLEAYLAIESEALCTSLASFGLLPNQERTSEAKGGIEKSRDFWRGLTDGQGCLTWARRSRSRKRYSYPHVALSGSKPLLVQFCAFLKTIKVTANPKPLGDTWVIHLYCGNAVTTTKALYDKSTVCLPRQKRTASAFRRHYAKPMCEIDTSEYPYSLYQDYENWKKLKAFEGVNFSNSELEIRTRTKSYSTGVCYEGGRIIVTAGTNIADGRSTLLHEMAHAFCMKNDLDFAHGEAWRITFSESIAEATGIPVPIRLDTKRTVDEDATTVMEGVMLSKGGVFTRTTKKRKKKGKRGRGVQCC